MFKPKQTPKRVWLAPSPENHGPTDAYAHLYDPGRYHWIRKTFPWLTELEALAGMYAMPRMAGGSGTLTNYAETSTLNWSTHQATMPTNTAPYAALHLVLQDSSKTGTNWDAGGTIPVYTGPYARVALAAVFPAATAGGAGAASSVVNSAGALTFPACTSGTATIVGWGIADAATVGNAIHWGSCTSTTVSSTQTPPTIASSALSLQLT
jgi:hypothetical protein